MSGKVAITCVVLILVLQLLSAAFPARDFPKLYNTIAVVGVLTFFTGVGAFIRFIWKF